jgi:hypothetical protein
MVLLMKPRATSTSEEYSGDVRSAAFGSRFIILFRLARRFASAKRWLGSKRQTARAHSLAMSNNATRHHPPNRSGGRNRLKMVVWLESCLGRQSNQSRAAGWYVEQHLATRNLGRLGSRDLPCSIIRHGGAPQCHAAKSK